MFPGLCVVSVSHTLRSLAGVTGLERLPRSVDRALRTLALDVLFHLRPLWGSF